MRRYVRVVSAVVVAVLAVSSVARVVCADECASYDAAVAADATEHCHGVETGDTPTLGSVAPEGCSPLRVGDIAWRERPNEPIRTAPLALAHVPVGDGYSRQHTRVTRETQPGGMCAGLSPGTLLPLRI